MGVRKRVNSLSLTEKDFKNSINSFFGINLNEEQKYLRDSIFDNTKNLVWVNAKAGTGKTTISVCAGVLLVQYGLYSGITYVVSPVEESTQGFRPGTVEEKSTDYMAPLYQALAEANLDFNKVVRSASNVVGRKEGTDFVECMTHTFLRGTNLKNKVIIIDEAQNFYFDQLKKTLTRLHDSCKIIVCGHSGQCDIISHPERSGFSFYENILRSDIDSGSVDWATICNLSENFRGKVSRWADGVSFSL